MADDVRRGGSIPIGGPIRIAVSIAVSVVITMLVMVLSGWQPLLALDDAVLRSATDLVAGSPGTVWLLRVLTALGSWRVGGILYPVAVGWFLVRGSPRLAGFMAVAGLGAGLLDDVVKVLVGRARPVVDPTLATASGMSFPSGHAMGATITCGALLLVLLPVTPSSWRRWMVAAVVAAAVVIGATRVLLGVHHPSDVVAGWALGVCWLAIIALVFRPDLNPA